MNPARINASLLVLACLLLVSARVSYGETADAVKGTIHVHPGESIQAALDRAAENPDTAHVIVHAGTYRPPAPRQALIWFNQRHDGITLEAQGQVVLTAANPDVADKAASSFPAIVNHVVYFGDHIGPRTTLRGFKITGANNFVTMDQGPKIQPQIDEPKLKKTLFFYRDGGGIKIFGRSYPTIDNVEIYDNYSSPCGAGISIEHRGFMDQAVTIRNSVFRDNRVPLTGAAIDLLDHELGSAAVIENCLFVDNLANCPKQDAVSRWLETWKPRAGHGAITVFWFSRAVVRKCTFVGNRNGVDDGSRDSTYSDCIFWQNTAPGGWSVGKRYEMDILNGPGVEGCFLGGDLADARGCIDADKNVLDAPDPEFDESYRPRQPLYRDTGYRPITP